MARDFKVKGTKEYLYWSLGLLALAIYCTKDGWWPPQSKIDAKTPEELKFFVVFNQSGAIVLYIASAICAYIHKVVK